MEDNKSFEECLARLNDLSADCKKKLEEAKLSIETFRGKDNG